MSAKGDDSRSAILLASVPDASLLVHDAKSETAMPKTNDAALAAFIARKTETDAALDRIRTASDDHFFAQPRGRKLGPCHCPRGPRRPPQADHRHEGERSDAA